MHEPREPLSATPARNGRATIEPARLDDGYLPLKMLAGYSGMCVRTLRTLLTHPVHPLPYYRFGGKVLVRRSDFDRWASQFRSESPSMVDALVRETLKGL